MVLMGHRVEKHFSTQPPVSRQSVYLGGASGTRKQPEVGSPQPAEQYPRAGPVTSPCGHSPLQPQLPTGRGWELGPRGWELPAPSLACHISQKLKSAARTSSFHMPPTPGAPCHLPATALLS